MSEDSDSIAEHEIDETMANQNTIPQLPTHKRQSFVWKFFSPVPDHSNVFRCNVCNETFANKTTNLSRHLQSVHGLADHQQDSVKKGRPNRSFVWNFCTKLDEKRALCHICKKVLYFGGGNTSNITKHLRRMHSEKLEEVAKQMPLNMRWSMEQSTRKERRSSSYVWNHCEKLTTDTVLCRICNRRMRFHGTANVITHLQRRHGIMDETTQVKTETPDRVQEAATSSTNENPRRNISGSQVWRYITRISDDAVRCRVCLKNLSYQGTSNLQRHLHRMHNIVWNSQHPSGPVKAESLDFDDNSFFAFCETTSDPTVWKCQMCDEHFVHTDNLEEVISKHMIKIHSAAMRGETVESFAPTEEEDEEFATLYTEVVADDHNTTVSGEVSEQARVTNVVAEDALYDDLIEIDEDLQTAEEVGEQFAVESDRYGNTLPAQSGENVVSDYSNDSTDAQLVTTTIQADDTPVMRELKEDLLRQQAMYFSEKAGFYRMQKFLVAQQVLKERLEIEKLKSGQQQQQVS
ncbi:uncharacterized protein LOC6574739 isoform X2 [Drosophila mojavensis]|uniref:Uncharacterized protein, isoform B n=1 Tax=Drosophila mojavensis TaxID=7230 RepID=B4K5Z3_DROMO|nr:uncharacterized protein LOC6574739 isoform X2 [Drosophila mojavensis]EDW16230.2 uncharacterized protein Dmoj_GI10409, isoform B [Drosophila mojavensis]